jgi:hypothetical protein
MPHEERSDEIHFSFACSRSCSCVKDHKKRTTNYNRLLTRNRNSCRSWYLYKVTTSNLSRIIVTCDSSFIHIILWHHIDPSPSTTWISDRIRNSRGILHCRRAQRWDLARSLSLQDLLSRIPTWWFNGGIPKNRIVAAVSSSTSLPVPVFIPLELIDFKILCAPDPQVVFIE